MFCPNCGKPVRDDAVFCVSCGFRVRTQETAQPAFQPAPQPFQPAPQPVVPQVTPPATPPEVRSGLISTMRSRAPEQPAIPAAPMQPQVPVQPEPAIQPETQIQPDVPVTPVIPVQPEEPVQPRQQYTYTAPVYSAPEYSNPAVPKVKEKKFYPAMKVMAIITASLALVIGFWGFKVVYGFNWIGTGLDIALPMVLMLAAACLMNVAPRFVILIPFGYELVIRVKDYINFGQGYYMPADHVLFWGFSLAVLLVILALIIRKKGFSIPAGIILCLLALHFSSYQLMHFCYLMRICYLLIKGAISFEGFMKICTANNSDSGSLLMIICYLNYYLAFAFMAFGIKSKKKTV